MATMKKPAAAADPQKGPSKGAHNPKTQGSRTIEGEAAEVKKKKRTSLPQFLNQVRDEARKVTWTTRNETMVSTVMVLIMVAIMALFFFIVDQILRFGVQWILQL
jgi:preprotein translocase subunit SecE